MDLQTTLKIGEFEVHRVGFGAMRLTGFRPERDRTEAIRHLGLSE